MTTASDIAAEIAGATSDASVAAAAAQTAVAAADAAVVMAEVQTAQAVQEAAAQIAEHQEEVNTLEGKISWLENEMAQTRSALEAQNMATMAELSAIKAMVESVVLTSQASPSSILPPSPEVEPSSQVQVNNPAEAVVVQQEAAASAAPSQKPSVRLKRL